MVNRDFNFDGYNDKQHRMMTKTRTESGWYYTSDVYFKTYATGKGGLGYISFHDDENEFAYKAGGELSKLKIYVEFEDSTQAENAEIYRIDGGRYELAEAKRVNSRTYKIVLDKATIGEGKVDLRYRIVYSNESVTE